jgi:glutamine synthetase adenylyltransferase
MGRRTKEDMQVSLFPFMSILACLIGILTLMISVSMVANQKQVGMTDGELRFAQENKRIKALIVKKKKELEDANKATEKNRNASIDLQKLLEMLAKLKAELAELDNNKLASPEEIQSAIDAYKAETLAIQKEQPAFQRLINLLLAKLDLGHLLNVQKMLKHLTKLASTVFPMPINSFYTSFTMNEPGVGFPS